MARPRGDIEPRVLEAARKRFLEQGVDGASLRKIAEDAGTNIGMIYYYFPTKEALFDGLTAAMPEMVATPDGDVPATAHSPAELAAGMPGVYRYLEANRRMFRAMSASELGGRVAESRRPERHGRMDAALEPLRERLDDHEYRRLRAVIGLVVSFDAFDALTDVWGLTRDEAAEAAAWAVRTLCDRARRSGVTP